MNYELTPSNFHASDNTSDSSSVDRPLKHGPLLFYNVGLEVKWHRWYLGAVLVVSLSSLIAGILILTVAHTPSFYWLIKYLRFVYFLTFIYLFIYLFIIRWNGTRYKICENGLLIRRPPSISK